MTSKASKNSSKGILLNRYYDRRDISSISDKPFFKMPKVQFGYGFMDSSFNPALLTEIPLTATVKDITNVYVDENPVWFYHADTKTLTLRTEIPAHAAGIPDTGANVNIAMVLDETGEAVAVIANQLVVVNPDRGFQISVVLNTIRD